MAFSFANTGSGPSAGEVGWFDFGSGFTIAPGSTVTGLTGTLPNGITVTFDLTLTSLGGAPRNYSAVSAPIAGAYFGSAGYTGLAGSTVLYSDLGTANNLSNLTFSNIVVKDDQGNPMPDYTVVMADGVNTSGIPHFEAGLSFTTNGGDWSQLAALGNTNPPTVIGGGSLIGFIGVSTPPNTAFVYTTLSPTQVVASLEEALAETRQGVAIGFAATVQPLKDLSGRRFPSDQFRLGITGGPAAPNGASGADVSNTADVTVGTARVQSTKSTNKAIAYPGDIITYSFALKNTGNVPADLVAITDPVPNGTTYVTGSVTASVPFAGDPTTIITLASPIAPGQTVTLSFQVKVTGSPNPNPIQNVATIRFSYTVDPANPDSVIVTTTTNAALTAVFANNYSQQISDLIHSVALEEAALAAIANAEGAKIQAIVAMGDASQQELLCLNKSVADMLDSISLLESILKQKLNTVSCQINGPCI